MVTAIGAWLCLVFVWGEHWFGVFFGLFIGLFGLLALLYPDDAFRSTPKELPVRGTPNPEPEEKES